MSGPNRDRKGAEPFGGQRPPGVPVAYLITFRTYGTWLPGDARGTVDDSHNEPDTPLIPEIPGRVRDAERRLNGERVILMPEQRAVVTRTVHEVCAHCGWKLWHVEVRTNHVHGVVTADSKPEPIMNRWKSWATRRLVEAGLVTRGAPIWARHGSTRYLWDWVSVQGAIAYARDRQ